MSKFFSNNLLSSITIFNFATEISNFIPSLLKIYAVLCNTLLMVKLTHKYIVQGVPIKIIKLSATSEYFFTNSF